MDIRHLHSAWDVDRRIVLDSGDKLVLIRFSSYENPPAAMLFADQKTVPETRKRVKVEGIRLPQGQPDARAVSGMEHYLCTQRMDELLTRLAPKVRKYCVIYAVDTNEVTEFNHMYELGHDRDPFAILFFYRNTHIKVDVGTGNNNKINFFAFEDLDDFLPIVDAAFRAGKLEKQFASSDKKFSTVSLRR